jgi:S-DNA-T family DNA segregation ATPase FtsK/SpoIIIE
MVAGLRLDREVGGLAIVVVALLSALGIYVSWAGPFGRGVRAAAGGLVGWAQVLLPIGLIAIGVLLVRPPRAEAPQRTTTGYARRAPTGRPAGRQSPAGPAVPAGPARVTPARISVAVALAITALAGLLALARDRTSLRLPLSSLRGGGGLVGALVAGSLRGGLGSWAAGLVLAVALAYGLLAAAGVPVRSAVGAGWGTLLALLHAPGRAWTWLGAGADSSDGDAVGAFGEGPSGTGAEGASGSEEAGPKAEGDRDPNGERAGGAPERGPSAEELAARAASQLTASSGRSGASGVEQLRLNIGPAVGPWRLPPMRLLAAAKAEPVDHRQLAQEGRVLEQALAGHGVATRLVGMTVGPTVTRHELELGPGVKVARVTSLAKDIAYAMASPDVRILAPIPGRSAIGVEVPNRRRQLVTLADVLRTDEAGQANNPLDVAMGRDIAGRPVMLNLAEMPHLLIAGATGAGKSSCINSLVTSVLMRATPEQVRLILVDPKRVELGQYNGLPHLLTQVVVNPKRAANALDWAVHEMERRYDLLAEVGVRDIVGYNLAVERGELGGEPVGQGRSDELPQEEPDVEPKGKGEDPDEDRPSRLPYVLVVVDELNDLMMVAARDVEESICRIAQMARAVGVHLVIATQRPSVDVITGVIKANIPSRLAFSVSSLADSRVILDQGGAERLVGRGDMLLLTASSSVPRRLQAPWVSEAEVRSVVASWRRQGQPEYVEGVEGDEAGRGAGQDELSDDDDLVREAMELVVRAQLGSTSMLQRRLRVGFARAGRLMDLLERRGVVGPSEGSKARAVLMTPEELDDLSAR